MIIKDKARNTIVQPDFQRPHWLTTPYRDPSRSWLDKNENTDATMQAIIKKVIADMPTSIYCSYPDSVALYKKLASSLKVNPEQLLLAAGSDGVIRAVFEAFVSPGDRVLYTNPTFAMYSVYADMYAATSIKLDYTASPEGPVLSMQEIIEAIAKHKPKLVCLPNPDSPTGTLFGADDINALLECATQHEAIVLIDEAYYPISEFTSLSFLQHYNNLIIARSTGKAWAMAGFRIGYAISSMEIARLLHAVRPMYEVNTLAVYVFYRMLDHESDMLASVSRLQQGKSYFSQALNAMGFKTLSTRGNFIHVNFADKAKNIHGALANTVYYRQQFSHPCLRGFSRFSLADEEVMRRIISIISTCTTKTGVSR